MSTGLIVGLAVVVVVVVLILIRVAARSITVERVHERALKAARRATAADLADGTTGRLAGVVTSDATLRAPLTGRPCVAYVARVEEKIARGDTKGWVERIHEVKGLPFTIDDGTGRALIDPGQATMLLQMDAATRSGVLDSATPVEASFLARHGLDSQGWLLNKTFRYTEGVIEPGERVAILGRGAREPDPSTAADEAGYRSALSTRVRIAGTPDEPVLVTDRADLIGP